MLHGAGFMLANFTVSEAVGVNAQSMLLILPLAAAIAVVYKAIKLPEIRAVSFLKETVILFGSILVFIIITGLVLFALEWLLAQ